MRKFSENPDYWIDRFSNEFQKGMIDLVTVLGRSDWVSIERVYTEYRKARNQTRLNGTRWTELEDFARSLKENPNDRVESEFRPSEGWFLKWKETDSAHLSQEKQAQKTKKILTEQEKELKVIENLIKKNQTKNEVQNILPQSVDIKSVGSISLSLNKQKNTNKQEKKTNTKKEFNHLDLFQETKKLKIENPNCWLFENIIVKIQDPNSEHKNEKAKIISVDYQTETASLETEAIQMIPKIHQDNLETVIPSFGKPVLIVKGPHKGEKG